ncbi:MAG: hypothetical protein JSV00_06925 [bacterium]|nr:MAG: hypothetical protein JSV00_06925 [bacterium]
MAARALKGLDPEKVTALLRDPALSRDAIVYFTRHAGQRVDWIESLLNNPSLPDEERSVLLSSRDSLTPGGEPGEGDDDSLSLSQRIQAMTVGEKIKLAMKGDKEARNILVKDNNKQVYMAVLGNPGLKESEIEMLARNTGTNTEILRAICRNREWISNRNIMHSVVMNPKTPPEISIRFLPRLSKKDLDFITKSRSLPQALRTNAKRLLLSKAKGR